MEINSLSLDSIKSLYYHLINTNEEYDTIIYNNRNNFIRLNEFITEIDDNVKNLQYLKCKTPNNEYLIKETLEKFNLLGVRKLDKKEESIINVRELADFLAQEEAERIHIGFHPEKDKGKYDELYKKHYKNIIKFRSKN